MTGRGTTAGEIDIVAKKRKTIGFAEVKERQTKESALYAIKPQQQKRILRAAENYLVKHREYEGFDVRFDAILISGLFDVTHIKNAWRLGLG